MSLILLERSHKAKKKKGGCILKKIGLGFDNCCETICLRNFHLKPKSPRIPNFFRRRKKYLWIGNSVFW